MRGLVGEHVVAVHPGAAVAQARRGRHRAPDVPRPDRAGEAVVGVVRPRHRGVDVREGRDRDDGAEDLALDYLVPLRGAGHEGGAVEEAPALAGAAADQHLARAPGPRALDEAGHAPAVLLRDQRPHLVGRVVLGAEADGRDLPLEARHEVVVDAPVRVDAAGGGAVLPGVVEAEAAHALGHEVEVGVVEHDHRRLAAELEVGALEGRRGRLHHPPPGADGAGQARHVHRAVRYQGLAGRRAPPQHDAHHPRREDLGEIAAQPQRGQRRHLRGLEDERVARRQDGAELPRRHHQRVVPGRDGGDHAHGVAPDHRGVAGEVLGGGGRLHRARGPGEEAQAVDDGGDLVAHHHVAGLAAVEHLEVAVLVGGGLYARGELEHAGRALGGGRARPGGEGLGGPAHGGVDLLGRRLARAHQLAPGRGVEGGHLVSRPGGQLAAHEHLERRQRRRLLRRRGCVHLSESPLFSARGARGAAPAPGGGPMVRPGSPPRKPPVAPGGPPGGRRPRGPPRGGSGRGPPRRGPGPPAGGAGGGLSRARPPRPGSGGRRSGSAPASPRPPSPPPRWSPGAGAGAPAPRASRSAGSSAARR